LAYGADVNVCDEERWRPLHHAAHTSSLRVMALLLAARGVDVNASSNKRWRPIDVCSSADAARMLLDAGAVQSSAAPGSLSALHHAVYQARPDVVEVLLARGASVTETFSPEAGEISFMCGFGGTALHLAARSLGCTLNLRQAMGENFDLLAPQVAHASEAATRRAAVCEALLHAGADINALTRPTAEEELHNFRMTPLMVASRMGDAAVIRALLRAGAHVDAVEALTSCSALHFAAQEGHADAIYALVAGGADVNKGVRSASQNVHTASPLWFAVMYNHHGVVRALLELGAESSQVALALSRPPALLPRVVDDATRALVARYRRGAVAPSRACALPDCEARRRASYDDKKLMMCPCKVRPGAAAASRRIRASAEPCALSLCRSLRSTAARSTRCWTASATRRRAKRRAARRKSPPEPLSVAAACKRCARDRRTGQHAAGRQRAQSITHNVWSATHTGRSHRRRLGVNVHADTDCTFKLHPAPARLAAVAPCTPSCAPPPSASPGAPCSSTPRWRGCTRCNA
jgi:ankyrin repeat protein